MTYEEAETFVSIWWQSKTLAEVCRKTGMDKRAASNMAAKLRRKEIPLKSMWQPKGTWSHKWLTRDEVARLVEVAKAARTRAKVSSAGGA